MGTYLFFADNPDTMLEIWKQVFLQVLDKHAPIQNKNTKSKKILGLLVV
jgi:hypothetical protein